MFDYGSFLLSLAKSFGPKLLNTQEMSNKGFQS